MATATPTILFSPTQISGCQLWFDAADSSTFTYSSGTSISQWRDKSSNAYSVIQPTTGRQPSLTSAAQNGLAGIQFATNTFLYQTATSMPNFTSGGSTSVLIAARNATVNTGWNIINTVWFNSSGGNANQRYHFSFNQSSTNGTTLYTNGGLVAVVTSNAVPSSTNAILGFTASATSQTIHTNGSVNSYTGVTLPNASGATAFIFNDPRNDAGVAANIIIFEMLGYNTQITTVQRQQLEGYLAWKWGMQGNLPATHPYKQTPVYALPPFPLVPKIPFTTNVAVLDPRTVANCVLWMDAADRSTLTLSGTSVTQWRDKSTNRYVFAPLGTNTGPSYTNSFNNLPCVESTSVNNIMGNTRTVPASSINSASGISYFIVYEFISGAVTVQFELTGTTGSRILSYEGLSFLTEYKIVYTAPQVTVIPNISFTNVNLTTGTLTAAFNGTTLINASGITTANTNYSSGWGFFGQNSGTNGNYGSLCRIAEFINYSVPLTVAQQQLVEGYLAWKWSLVDSLPNGHPYKRPPIAPFPYATYRTSLATFIPLMINGCSLWLDAKDPTTLFSDSAGTIPANVGGTIGYWRDKSSAGRHFTQSVSARQPLYQTTAITFNTIDHLLINASSWASSGWDVFFVGNPLASTSLWRTLFRGLNNDVPILVEFGSTRFGYYSGSTFRQFGSLTFPGGTTRLAYVSITSSRVYSASLDGTINTSAASGTGTAESQMFYYLGNSVPGVNQPWGTVNEIIILPNVTLSQRQQIEGYLAWKWGLQANLPGAHPYKFFPPSPV